MDIRAAEISAILKQQIANFGAEAEVAEVGQVQLGQFLQLLHHGQGRGRQLGRLNRLARLHHGVDHGRVVGGHVGIGLAGVDHAVVVLVLGPVLHAAVIGVGVERIGLGRAHVAVGDGRYGGAHVGLVGAAPPLVAIDESRSAAVVVSVALAALALAIAAIWGRSRPTAG